VRAVAPAFKARRSQRDDRRAVAALVADGGRVRAHERMRGESLAYGVPQCTGALSVHDAHAIVSGDRGAVEVAVELGQRLLGARAAEVQLQRDVLRGALDDGPGGADRRIEPRR